MPKTLFVCRENIIETTVSKTFGTYQKKRRQLVQICRTIAIIFIVIDSPSPYHVGLSRLCYGFVSTEIKVCCVAAKLLKPIATTYSDLLITKLLLKIVLLTTMGNSYSHHSVPTTPCGNARHATTYFKVISCFHHEPFLTLPYLHTK